MKAGLEVHQQLATEKLFCACPSELSEVVVAEARRRLRATVGENQAVDRAAAYTASRGLTFHYEATPTSCLIDLDEEPPHALNEEALDVALTVALLLDARPIDEVQVMRKIVVDGSNTTGFQRTALVAVDGHLDLAGKRYSILSICLEEDAARKISEASGEARYRLDRLGIPLVEIATGPEVATGDEARAVAEEIGALLRATRKVRRGIGTIREDLNVSTAGGARIEIKGVQELRLLHRYAAGEEGRQRTLLGIRDQLVARGATVPDEPPIDLTSIIAPVAKGGLGEALRKGGTVRGIRLPGFGGLLRPSPKEEERLGRELADVARTSGLKGLVHSDELPAYGLDAGHAAAIREALRAPDPTDAFLLVAAPDGPTAERVLARVRDRARAALAGIPEETRDPLPDGRTRYSRPLPGRDRMYPETDVAPIPILPERLARLAAALPALPRETRRRLIDRYAVSEEVVRQLQQLDAVDRFELLVARGHPASLVGRLLTQQLPALAPPEGEAPDLPTDLLDGLLRAVADGRFAKEGLEPVLARLVAGASSVDDAVRQAGLATASTDDLDAMARALVADQAELVRARGEGAFAPLMGDLMKELRGRRDGQEVAGALRRALDQAQRTGPA